MKLKKPNFNSEWQFLQKCEADCYTAIFGKQRFIELLHIIHKIPEPKSILDIGGNLGTARWLETQFPNSKITILNKSKRELASYPRTIKADAQFFKAREKYDLIFAGEIIEHTYNPDGLICSCLSALKPKGHLVITTPNLACIYNRIFLLLGWSPGTYFPSLRYFVGNPFFSSSKIGDTGVIPDHKSVFTWNALEQLLKIYGFRIIDSRGYSYGQEKQLWTVGQKYCRANKGKLRLALNAVIPKKLREGMLFLCQAPINIDKIQLSKGTLKKNLWEL